jgi:ABC-2 type transport system permease protein
MNKIFLIIEREFLNRVGKKSFLVATILIPLIFPAITFLLIYIDKQSKSDKAKELVYYLDESKLFTMDNTDYNFVPLSGPLDSAKATYYKPAKKDLALLYIPKIDIDHPSGIKLYGARPINFEDEKAISSMLSNQLRDMKLERANIRKSTLDSLDSKVRIETLVNEGGTERTSDSVVVRVVGFTFGILMYTFIFIYGAQIMQGIIEEKTSKVVEVIISSVRPFQLMMGKILGLATVGLLQFFIWIVLMTTLTGLAINSAGVEPAAGAGGGSAGGNLAWLMETATLPWGYIIFCFLFYFLGGYLIYGALFAAVGSAVDSPAEAQQFMFPVTIPMLISYMSLFAFVVPHPDEPIAFWLSMIPFTSPIAMMGRLASGVPVWELLLSMALLIGGFIFTTWVAGRIYRVGILMSGTKVNYKVLAKWFLMKG